jgi:hypothetical protein
MEQNYQQKIPLKGAYLRKRYSKNSIIQMREMGSKQIRIYLGTKYVERYPYETYPYETKHFVAEAESGKLTRSIPVSPTQTLQGQSQSSELTRLLQPSSKLDLAPLLCPYSKGTDGPTTCNKETEEFLQ